MLNLSMHLLNNTSNTFHIMNAQFYIIMFDLYTVKNSLFFDFLFHILMHYHISSHVFLYTCSNIYFKPIKLFMYKVRTINCIVSSILNLGIAKLINRPEKFYVLTRVLSCIFYAYKYWNMSASVELNHLFVIAKFL